MSSVIDAVVADIAARRDELVALATELIAFDTTAREVADPPRDEAALQALIAGRLERAGAEVELWEPRPEDVAGTGQVPDGVGFEGRPQLLARLRGAAPGRTFLLNGHIDAVSYEPRDAWESDPLRAEVRDGRLCGRGAADMKGGVAAIVIAAEALARVGLPAGELLVSTVTDEESWGAGSLASVAHGVRADGGLVPEFTGFDAWLACRGVMSATVTVRGRPGHAEEAQPDWRAGGAVNAIDKAAVVLDGVRRLRDDWQGRPEHVDRFLPAPDIVATMISGGEWWVSYPARCTITFDITYLPAQADEAGAGGAVRAEIERWIAAAAELDPWLAAHPPVVEWGVDLPPAELDEDHEVVRGALAAARAVGRTGQPGALRSWHDAAVFTRVGGTPTISFGPDGTDGAGRSLAHAVDESVLVDDLVACSQALAIATLTFLQKGASPEPHARPTGE